MLIGDMFSVWRKGKEVANPAAWKNAGAMADSIASLLASGLAIAAAFGYQVDLSDPVVQMLAGGIAGVLYIFSGSVHIITSAKVGLPAKSGDSEGAAGSGGAGGPGSADLTNSVGVDPRDVQRFLDSGRR